MTIQPMLAGFLGAWEIILIIALMFMLMILAIFALGTLYLFLSYVIKKSSGSPPVNPPSEKL